MTLEVVAKPRRFSTCHRHPAEVVTGFCGSCLRERLAYLDSPGHPHHNLSSESAVLRTAVRGGGAIPAAPSSSVDPDLRRCKSYSARKYEAPVGPSEPRRNSCDVRVRNSLSHLFQVDDEDEAPGKAIKIESKKLGFSEVQVPVLEHGEDAEIEARARIPEHQLGQNVVREVEVEDSKTIREHIELEWQNRKQSSFWVAASAFSQKFQRWRLKQRKKKQAGDIIGGNREVNNLPSEKSNGRRIREDPSEVGDWRFGRRSCDTEPRISIDPVRISVDGPRISFDEPRASWDGYMIARTIPRLAPMLSVIESAMNQQMNSIIEDDTNSIGSGQTRDYCSESSSSQRRHSFDCSSSGKSSSKRRGPVEIDDMRSILHPKKSPITSAKIVVPGTDTKNLDLSLHYGLSRNSECGFKNEKSLERTSKWERMLEVLGLKNNKLADTRCGEVGGYEIGHPLGDNCCEELNREVNGIGNEASGKKLARSNSSSIDSYPRSSGTDTRESPKKSRGKPVLERNRSVRYSPSPSNFENGLLRFHLTPPLIRKRKSERRNLLS